MRTHFLDISDDSGRLVVNDTTGKVHLIDLERRAVTGSIAAVWVRVRLRTPSMFHGGPTSGSPRSKCEPTGCQRRFGWLPLV